MRIVKTIIALWEKYDILAQPSISKKKRFINDIIKSTDTLQISIFTRNGDTVTTYHKIDAYLFSCSLPVCRKARITDIIIGFCLFK